MSKTDNSHHIDKNSAFYKKVLITAGIIIPIILLLFLFGLAFRVVLLVLASVLITTIFRSIAGAISKRTPISMGWSLAISVTGVLVIIGLVWWLLAPRVMDQVNQLGQELPKTIENAKQQLNKSQLGSRLIEKLPENPTKFLQENKKVLKKTFGVFSATFGILADLYVILLLSLFFMSQPKPYKNGIINLFPPSKRDRAGEVLEKLYVVLQKWFQGKLLSMLVVTVLTALGLWALGIPLVLVLSLIAGLLSFIPNFGPLIALIPAVLMGLVEGPQTALFVVLLYIAVQAVESNLITPFIQQKMISVPMAMIIISQLVLGILTGGLGLVLATPIFAVVMVLVQELYVKDTLGDRQGANS